MPLNKICIHLFSLPGWSVLSCSKFRLVIAKKSWFWDFFCQQLLLPPSFTHTKSNHLAIHHVGIPALNKAVPLSWVAFGLVSHMLFDHRLLQWPWSLTGDGSQDTHCLSCPFPRSSSLVSSLAYRQPLHKGITGTALFLLQVLLDFTIFPTAAFLLWRWR